MNTNRFNYNICPRCGFDRTEVEWESSDNGRECVAVYWCERCELLYDENEYEEYIEG